MYVLYIHFYDLKEASMDSNILHMTHVFLEHFEHCKVYHEAMKTATSMNVWQNFVAYLIVVNDDHLSAN